MIVQHLKNINRAWQTYYDRSKYTRLDKNERNIPFSKKMINDIRKFAFNDILQSYPSSFKKLTNEISKRERIRKQYINVIPGSDSGIKYIFEVLSGSKKRTMAAVYPTYGMLDIYAKIYQYKFIRIISEKNLITNIKRIFNKKLSFFYIANPNQPSGKYIDQKTILNIVKIAQKKNIFVIIDEAYIDFCKFKSISCFVKKFKNLIVLKTFSKSFGLAGLRIGYLIANQKFNKILNSVRPCFDVSHFSLKVAEYLLRKIDIKNSYVKQINKNKKYLIKECKKRDLKFVNTEANFFYIKMPNSQIKKIYNFMFSKKIIIRTGFLNDFKNLNNSIRITVSNEATMRKFFILLDKIYKRN
jgi:histidinol-phosphate aminotransferase